MTAVTDPKISTKIEQKEECAVSTKSEKMWRRVRFGCLHDLYTLNAAKCGTAITSRQTFKKKMDVIEVSSQSGALSKVDFTSYFVVYVKILSSFIFNMALPKNSAGKSERQSEERQPLLPYLDNIINVMAIYKKPDEFRISVEYSVKNTSLV
ncbi:unnamed protein product [Onchocerca flexuosa]|uniref:ArgoN domain-containing protein n=1 Tax=Onchocerca flexuosa TaxID=387005 RepID=A0A183H386_9BILA|nr:unnamed protein product [Onchocerca flexuosa]